MDKLRTHNGIRCKTERSIREHHEREINSMVRCINTVIEKSLKTDKAHGLEGLFLPRAPDVGTAAIVCENAGDGHLVDDDRRYTLTHGHDGSKKFVTGRE